MALFNPRKDFDEPARQSTNIIIDVLDDDDFYYIYAEFSGREKDEIKLKFIKDQLLLKVHDSEDEFDSEKSYIINERNQFERERLISFPESIVKKEVIANYSNGLLEIIIKKMSQDDDDDLIPIN